MFTTSSAWHNYDVLETDYDEYSVVYSCQNLGKWFFKLEYAWILMREPHDHETISFEEIEAKGINVLKKAVPSYDVSNLRRNPAFEFKGDSPEEIQKAKDREKQ